MKIEKTVDRGSKEKLYVQIYSIILEKIESREWTSGNQIPPEDELCRIYDVSKVTVREAIQELVREGYLTRHQGKGTFVAYTVPHLGIVMRTRLSENMFGEEVKVRREVIERGFREVTSDIKKVLITEDADIYYILSRKIVDDEPFNEEIFVPSFILPGLETEEVHQKSLYDLIEEKGTKKIFRVVQTIEITKLQKEPAALLNEMDGASALLISRILVSSDGNPIAYTRLVGPGGGRNMVQMEFERIK
jgi:DNA-binding GntR family transcriptional regulator